MIGLVALVGGTGQASAATATNAFQVTGKDRSHWAFQPLLRPPVLTQHTERNIQNPIDAFVLARLNAKGLSPNPPASKQELIRRACYDLTGLPPSPSEVEAFVGDDSPQAWENLINRLLASPHYGEKWGRHWLDLVRFAESNSYERDGAKPNAWRYRDYVIRSFNADKPYDHFVREQLAGDEIPDPDADAIIATGFYRLGIWDDEPADRELARFDALDDIVATTSQVFLGLTMDCARCHNHKIDPIPQRDYYRLLAFFHNINPYRNSGPTDEVPIFAHTAQKRAYEERIRELGTAKTNSIPTDKALAVTESGAKAPETFLLVRGNPAVKGEPVEPGFPEVLGTLVPQFPQTSSSAKATGRRTVLANWIVSPANPLTARVMANRIWQHHFGRGIVRSPNNFGLQGEAPTHRELLDWLASEFIALGWRLKPMHHLIMTSDAYRMSSRGRDEALKTDPANDFLWRFDARRLAAEEIRDSILAVTGSLNPRMFGPSVFVEIPKEVQAGQSQPGNGWGKSPAAEQARRSIYIHAKRSLLTPILESFDLAETDRSAPVRFITVQPTQALGLLNSAFANQQAGIFAARLRQEAGPDLGQQVRLALGLVTSRRPSDQEIERGVRLIETLRVQDNAAAEQALKYFCLMALNLNEMIYLD